MSVKTKLDEIFAVLLRIEQSLTANKKSDDEMKVIAPGTEITPAALTKPQHDFKRKMEVMCEIIAHARFTVIKRQIVKVMKMRERDRNYVPRIDFSIPFKLIDEKINNTNAQFYKDLRQYIKNIEYAVNREAEKVVTRAIGRQNASSKRNAHKL